MSITWGQYAFEGPYLLDRWVPPRKAGVYAVMHKPNPTSKPQTYRIDYFGESGDLSDRGFPWNHEKSQCFINRAGSKSNVYIAVHFMPGSTLDDRQRVEKELINEYDPHCNED